MEENRNEAQEEALEMMQEIPQAFDNMLKKLEENGVGTPELVAKVSTIKEAFKALTVEDVMLLSEIVEEMEEEEEIKNMINETVDQLQYDD